MLSNRNLVTVVGKHPTGQGHAMIIQDRNKYKFIDNNNQGLQHDLMLIKIDNENTKDHENTKDLSTIPLPDHEKCSSPICNSTVDILGWMTATVDSHTKIKSELNACI